MQKAEGYPSVVFIVFVYSRVDNDSWLDGLPGSTVVEVTGGINYYLLSKCTLV